LKADLKTAAVCCEQGISAATPEEFWQTGYVESTERFPHLHRLDGGCELISKSIQNRENSGYQRLRNQGRSGGGKA
jgi:hypothetical protein